MKGISSKDVIYVMTLFLEKIPWKNILQRFMKEKAFSVWKSILIEHVASVHDGRKSFKCDICHSSYSKKSVTKHILNQFMKERNHSNATFATTLLLREWPWGNMLHQFMKEKGLFYKSWNEKTYGFSSWSEDVFLMWNLQLSFF